MRYIFIIFYLTIISCSEIKGKIEKRGKACNGVLNSKRAFIINESKTEKYQFTVKQTETINDTIKKYSTEQIVLEPGDEEDLGCDLYYSDKKYLSIEKIQILGLGDDTIQYSKVLVRFVDGSMLEIPQKNKQKAIERGARVIETLHFPSSNRTTVNKVTMKFRNGEVRDIDEADVKTAISLGAETVLLYDTIINNNLLGYYKYSVIDSTKIFSQKKHSIKYEVTGQVFLKAKANQ